MNARHVFSIAAASFAMIACRRSGDDYGAAAKEEFAKTYSCPNERIEIKKRDDLDAYELTVGKMEPPKEVASDPARLAEWKKHQAETIEGYRSEHVYFAKGCDHEVHYLCATGTSTNEQQVIACTKAQHPPTPDK